MSLFAAPEENPPIRQAIEFYKHPHNWSNRLIAGDSLLVDELVVGKGRNGGPGPDDVHRSALRDQIRVKFSALR